MFTLSSLRAKSSFSLHFQYITTPPNTIHSIEIVLGDFGMGLRYQTIPKTIIKALKESPGIKSLKISCESTNKLHFTSDNLIEAAKMLAEHGHHLDNVIVSANTEGAKEFAQSILTLAEKGKLKSYNLAPISATGWSSTEEIETLLGHANEFIKNKTCLKQHSASVVAISKTVDVVKNPQEEIDKTQAKEQQSQQAEQQHRQIEEEEQQHRQIQEEPQCRNEELNGNSPLMTNMSMMILGGFIAAVGITAVAIAFTVLNAATFGTAGLVVGIMGAAATLSGIGLFCSAAYRNRQSAPDELDFAESCTYQ